MQPCSLRRYVPLCGRVYTAPPGTAAFTLWDYPGVNPVDTMTLHEATFCPGQDLFIVMTLARSECLDSFRSIFLQVKLDLGNLMHVYFTPMWLNQS
jgi:hypothetical protein